MACCGPALLLLMPLLLLTGCLTLKRPYPQITQYAIEARRPEQPVASEPAVGSILKVRLMRTEEMFSNRKFVYARPNAEWISDYYNEFFIPPSQMITSTVEQWLTDARVAGRVLAASSQILPTHELEGRVRELYGDFSTPGRPHAVLRIELVLIDLRAGGRDTILLQKEYRRAVEFTDAADRASLVRAWSWALADIMTEAEADLRTAIAESMGSNSTP